jgi:hypothetical protein
MFSLKDPWSRPSSGREDPIKHRSDFSQSLGTIVVVGIILAVLSGFVWALIEFIKLKVH